MIISKSLYAATARVLQLVAKSVVMLFVMYIGFNMITFISIATGSVGQPDPFWHAPLYWLTQLK